MKSYLILIFSLISFNLFSQVDSLVVPNKVLLDFKKFDTINNKSNDSTTKEPLPNALKNVFDRLYIDEYGIDAYREHLTELLGRIVIKEDESNNMAI